MIKSHPIRVIALLILMGLPQSAFAQINELRSPDQGPFQLKTGTAENSWGLTNSNGFDSSADNGTTAANAPAFGAKEIDFGRLIMQLVVSTVLVLGICVAILIVAKKFRLDSLFMKKANPTTATPTTNMKLESTLRLGRCNTLHIVEAGGNRLAVGMDATGIKTIVPLQPVFSQQLQSMQPLTETPPTPEKRIDPVSPATKRDIDLTPPHRNRFGNYQGGFPTL